MAAWTAEMSVRARRDPASKVVVGLAGADAGIHAYDAVASICSIVPAFDRLKPATQELLDNTFQYKYFDHLVRKATASGIDVVAAPYDFRLMLDPLERCALFDRMRLRIEAAVAARGAPAVIVGHSLGGVVATWFLAAHVDEAWRLAHVAKLITLNAPFGGSPLATRALVCGEYYIPGYNRAFREGLQLNSGILMSLPNEWAFKDVAGMTSAVGEGPMEAWRALYCLEQLTLTTDIPIDVVVSEGVETMATFREDDGAARTTTDGDGLITAAGLDAALDVLRGPRVTRRVIDDTNHRSIVSDPRTIRYIVDECLLG
jgi:pimeloyl-ACP methyl ester carboxylesterase